MRETELSVKPTGNLEAEIKKKKLLKEDPITNHH